MGLFDSSNTTTTSTAPWVGAQPYLKQVMGAAQSDFGAGKGFNPPPMKDLFTPYSSQTQGALSGMWGLAQGGNPLQGSMYGTLSGMMPGGAMSNQYSGLLSGAGNDAFQKALQSQEQQTANTIDQQFSMNGRYGSGAQTGVLSQQLGNMANQALSQNWNQNIANQMGILSGQSGMQLQAAGMTPQAYQSALAPYQTEAQVGAAYDAQNQARTQAQLTRFNASQSAPWNRLSAYSSLVGGGALNGASSTQAPTNPFGMGIGGALSGAAIGSAIPGIGTGLGAGIGGIGGLLAGYL